MEDVLGDFGRESSEGRGAARTRLETKPSMGGCWREKRLKTHASCPGKEAHGKTKRPGEHCIHCSVPLAGAEPPHPPLARTC